MYRTLHFIGASLLFFSSAASAEDRRTDPSHLVIMQLNAEFLWDGVEPEEGSASFPWKGSPTEAREHMQRIAQIIAYSNPDIVNLCEVENMDALRMLNDDFLAGRGYKPYLTQGGDSTTGQDVALLTRIDPEGGSTTFDTRLGYDGTVHKSVTKNYTARIQIGGGEKIAIIGAHLLAQPNRLDRLHQRQAQADALRSMAVDQVAAGYQVVLMGDFNDYDGEASSRDHIDSMPITNVLVRLRTVDPGQTSDDLINVASLVPKATRYTSFWDQNDNGFVDSDSELTSIDHVLLSPTLNDNIESTEFVHDSNPDHATDHYPIVVRLRTGGGPPPLAAGAIRIVALLPNPSGNESQGESATLKNVGQTAVDLHGWKLRDRASTFWSLDSLGSIAPGQEKSILRAGQQMALNNTGDTIDLLDSSGNVVHSVSYGRADEDEAILFTP